MSRFRIAPSLLLLGVLALAACSANTGAPASPTTEPLPTVAPSDAPLPATPIPATPAPTKAPEVTPPPATPEPAARPFTEAEKNFFAGIQRDTENCRPVDGNDLPENAVIGIECDGTDPAVDRVGFYQFENEKDMIDAYRARMDAEGVEPDSGSCSDGEAEHAYFPGEDEITARAGCFVNDEGFANYRYTIPYKSVYVGILGNSADMLALENFAWKGNEDVPGQPTLWFGGID